MIRALVLLLAALPGSSLAQDTERTEGSAQQFLALKLNGLPIVAGQRQVGNRSIGQWAENWNNPVEWVREGRCDTWIKGLFYIHWTKVRKLESSLNYVALQTRSDYGYRLDLSGFDDSNRRRIHAAVDYLINVCDTSRSTGF